ncbi:MAG: 1-acyl-sn-glycerol-3-phosphate acyltransferase [Candidatus Omnitrophica bacterium]|nr:1-acyl-sn-glycerol-3-phosphate acyltransferase [Candidatus Omnitrophota bacterium]
MIYYFTYFFTKVLSFLFFPRTVRGWYNIPSQGAYILASNHISNLDPVILGISTPRRVHFMTKIELFKHPLVGWWLKKLWAFPVKRGQADLGALKEAFKCLKKGHPVLVFPEGTRRTDHKSLEPQPGTGFLALKSQVPIVPVYMKGSDVVMPPGAKFFKRSLVTVTYGKPFLVSDSPSYEAASRKILEEIYKLV